MSDDLSTVPQFNLLYRLREYFSVPANWTAELERRLNRGKYAADELESAKRRIAYLEQHVPPEIINPPKREACRPRFTGD
jgi:hypothetical protein